jgi:uncharacterized protein
MFVITISGPVVVTDDETEKPITDAKRLATFDGLHSGKETCSKYHSGELTDLELKGGAVKLVFDSKAMKLRVVSEFTSARKLTLTELRELIDDTQGQWSDGIGEGCFDSVMDKREVFINLSPDTGGKVKATQVDDGTPAPKKSAAKVAASALAKAIENGDLEAVKQLVAAKAKLDTRGKYGMTPLIAAISGDKLEIALYLLEHGASPTATDKEKCDPLSWAAIRSGWVMKHQNVKLAEALLAAGAPVDSRNKDGYTPLLWAANRGAVKLVELLLARGAGVNAKTTQKYNSGRTALMLAQNIAMVRVLLDAGADPRAVEENGMHTWDFHTGAAAKLLKETAGTK